MRNFEFQNPVKLLFGEGVINKISNEIMPGTHVLLTYGGGSIKRNGVYTQVMKALKDCKVTEFGGIEPNPDYSTLMKAINICKKEDIDFVLSVGGGSVCDGSKFIVAGALYEGDPWDFTKDSSKIRKALPLGVIMTLPATSSEMNNGGVISRRELGEKWAFSSPYIFPKFSVLDPHTLRTLPKKQISNGLADIFVHVMEQYLTTTDHYMVTDRFSEGILLSLIELAPKIMEGDDVDYKTLANYMLIGTIGLNGWIAMGTVQDWATHMIGHELTAITGLDHGETLAIIYPGTMNIMRDAKHDKLLQYGERVWGINKGTEEERIDKAIAKTEEYFIKIGKKVTLGEYNLGEEVADLIADRFKERGYNIGENGIVNSETVREILKSRIGTPKNDY